MGAFLQFKRETGREVTEMKDDLTDQVTFLYCCVASAARADKKAFDYTFEEFVDNVSLEDMQQWQDTNRKDSAADADDAKKNSR